jgi:hypothetical protein
MRPHCSWNRIGAMTSGLALAGLALTGRPARAQQTAAVSDTTPLTLLMVIFPDTTAAQTAMTNLSATPTSANGAQPTNQAAPPNTAGNPAPVEWVEPYYAIASKDKTGKVNVQHRGTKGSSASDTRADNSIDGVSAMLAERPGKSNKNGGQAGAGASRAGISSANMSDMQNLLTPGEAALIIVVPTADVATATTDLKQGNASEVYNAPLASPSQ